MDALCHNLLIYKVIHPIGYGMVNYFWQKALHRLNDWD